MLTGEWQRARACGTNACVEVRREGGSGGNYCDSGQCVEVRFVTAVKSNGNGGNNCVEVGFATADSSMNNGTCVEVSSTHTESTECDCAQINVDGRPTGAVLGDVLVRDSKDGGGGPILVFADWQWRHFLDDVRAVAMDWPRTAGTGMFVIGDPNEGDVELYFTEAEWDAFLDGVRKDEFAIG